MFIRVERCTEAFCFPDTEKEDVVKKGLKWAGLGVALSMVVTAVAAAQGNGTAVSSVTTQIDTIWLLMAA